MFKKNRRSFGKVFTDEFNKHSNNYKHFDSKKSGRGLDWEEGLVGGYSSKQLYPNLLVSPWRRLFLALVLIILGTVFFARLFHLQIVEGSDNRERADFNRIQIRVIHAPRGVVYDRNGKVMALNEPGFRLVEASGSGKVAKFISRDESLKMEVEHDPAFNSLEIDSVRSYPLSEKTAHILGYVGEITEDELKQENFQGYKLGDKIGRGGIEESFEKVLRGIDGGEIIEVDAAGKKLRTLRETVAVPGQNLYLTIDSDLQTVAFDKLKEGIEKSKSCCGAVVIQNPQNGEILAMVSYPTFDPEDIGQALISDNSPILNRAIAGEYPPGSTFKIASSLAGLLSGKITAKTIYEDTGIISLGKFTFSNWYFTQYGGKEGSVDLVKALQRSNDTYYYHLGQTVGEKEIGHAANLLGLGQKLGIDIPGESAGLIPDDAWKQENIGDVWYPGDTLHMSIGQGFVLSTPLQINNMTSVIAADGKSYPPHLALKVTTPTDKEVKSYSYDPKVVKEFKPEDIKLVQKGLNAVPKSGGTAWPFFNFPIATSGKTGTAEYGDIKHTHAWYTGYAPTENPKISATVLIEGGGEGSSTGSPIIKEILRWFFSSDKKNLIKDIAPIASDSAKLQGE